MADLRETLRDCNDCFERIDIVTKQRDRLGEAVVKTGIEAQGERKKGRIEGAGVVGGVLLILLIILK